MDFITKPLGTILHWMYSITGNYGFAIVLFTIAVKIILLPLAVKQQKAMVDMQKVQPLLNEVQKKYKNDKEKLNKEIMKIYSEHKVNPMGSCLPLLIQLPIMFGLYRVIYQPLTYILKLSAEKISELATALSLSVNNEIAIAKMSSEVLVNFSFLGLDLSQTPQFNSPHIIWIIPILSGLSSYLASKIAMATSPSAASANSQNMAASSSMMKIMPIMSMVICFSLPAGVGLYWIISNIVQVVQQVSLNKYFARFKKEETIVEKSS